MKNNEWYTLNPFRVKYIYIMYSNLIFFNFRRAYHITSYFTFFFNIFIGLGSCLLRVVFGLIYGVIFLQRLQKSTLPREIESRDPGKLKFVYLIWGYYVREKLKQVLKIQLKTKLHFVQKWAFRNRLILGISWNLPVTFSWILFKFNYFCKWNIYPGSRKTVQRMLNFKFNYLLDQVKKAFSSCFSLGFMAYCGYILLEHQHANPILQCFSKFLTEEIPAESNKSLFSYCNFF